MSIQIAFSPVDGQLLGAQVAGYDGADKRLDILSSIVQRKGTIYDLVEFEHAYAPPYSSAKDPVNMAGFVAENILEKRLNVIYWNDTKQISKNDFLVDVRSPEEFSLGSIPNAINIPVDDLRKRLNELPKDKNIYIFCQVGLRGYLAQRILLQNGYKNARNISGGYALWSTCTDEERISQADMNIMEPIMNGHQ
jgi:rhodanese-related sulfurtransferase